jgi:hypothetical protein
VSVTKPNSTSLLVWRRNLSISGYGRKQRNTHYQLPFHHSQL